MALHWRPVGPEPASTYWQRRAVVAAGVLLVPVLLVPLLSGEGDEPDELAQEAPALVGPSIPTASPSASPSAVPSPTAAPTCSPQTITVDAAAEQDSYPVGASVRLALSVVNTGPAPCTQDVGRGAVELLVFSGRDRIWSSDDCSPSAAQDVTTLQPGEPVVQTLTWDARRSVPGCGGKKAQALPGTYRVSGRVGEQVVEGDVFRITG